MKRLVLLIALLLPISTVSAHDAQGNLTAAEEDQIFSLQSRRVFSQWQMSHELAQKPVNWVNVLSLALYILDLDDDVSDIENGAVHL